jgi:hypothetical protein
VMSPEPTPRRGCCTRWAPTPTWCTRPASSTRGGYDSSTRSTPTAPAPRRCRPRRRRAPVRARVVEQPVRHQPGQGRHVPS